MPCKNPKDPANLTRLHATQKEYRRLNADKIKERQRRWRLANPERMKEYFRRYNKSHRQERNAYMCRRRQEQAWWYIKLKEQKHAEYHALKNQIFNLLGNSCSHCGYNDKRALQIDHVLGGGTVELRQLPRKDYLEKVLATIQEGNGIYQLLCANCNWIKRIENKEVPHNWKYF